MCCHRNQCFGHSIVGSLTDSLLGRIGDALVFEETSERSWVCDVEAVLVSSMQQVQ